MNKILKSIINLYLAKDSSQFRIVVRQQIEIKFWEMPVPIFLLYQKNEILDDEIETIPGKSVSPSTFTINATTMIIHFLKIRPTLFLISHSYRRSTFYCAILFFLQIENMRQDCSEHRFDKNKITYIYNSRFSQFF